MAEKYNYTSSWTLPATSRQVAAVARMCIRKGIREHLEEKPMTRWEARRLLYKLSQLKDI